MDTPELRDQMIREELSECGNFNTALNVISAFKYQYDPEMFEMCLKYPNMYAPKEVKDNLEKQGLRVKDCEGDLLHNLKYVCEKEDIDIDMESFEGVGEKELLNEIAELTGKTIEIHTQNHDEPVKYINEEAIDEEPLRLFYCEDDKTYSPIVKKDRKQKITKKSIEPPKKRPKLFDVHQHPDLEVLWKIKEGSIDLNKTFSQGVLDVDINWSEKRWKEKLSQLKKFMDEHDSTPRTKSKNGEEKVLGKWLSHQKANYGKKTCIMKQKEIYDKWTGIITDYAKYIISNEDLWYLKLQELKAFIATHDSTPSAMSKNDEEKVLGQWLSYQKANYGKKIYSMKQKEIYDKWTGFIADYAKYIGSPDDLWDLKLQELKAFIATHDSTPRTKSKNDEEKVLGQWLSHQKTNYGKKVHSMKQKEIFDKWTGFITDYAKYFISNDDLWDLKLQELKVFIATHDSTPGRTSKNGEEKVLGQWLSTQKTNYGKKTYRMKQKEIYDKWTGFITDYAKYFISNDDLWDLKLQELKTFIATHDSTPSTTSKNGEEKVLGQWQSKQKTNYGKKTQIMKQKEIYDKWTGFINDPKYKQHFQKSKPKKDMTKPEIKLKKSSQEITARQQRIQSELSILHQQYKIKNSQTLNTYFRENPEKWEQYHQISKANETSFPEEEIPRNKIIKYLEKLPGKKQKIVADLGCGFAEIKQHFTHNKRFVFHNFDHQSANEFVIERDIENTQLEDYSVDIAILSLAMWGSNCKDYLKEVYRILDTGGTLLIAEAFRRWNKELDDEGKPINRLVKLLEKNNFTIVENQEQKFMFIECRKNK